MSCYIAWIDQEGLPDYWGIETLANPEATAIGEFEYQEGLPDYWGIETRRCALRENLSRLHQEGLPDYWGIETRSCLFLQHLLK